MKEQGWEINSLDTIYRQFRDQLNQEFGFDFIPNKPTILRLGTDSSLNMAKESILKLLDKEDNTVYVFFFIRDLLPDYSWLHPEHSKVATIPVDTGKLEELYALGKEEMEKLAHKKAC